MTQKKAVSFILTGLLVGYVLAMFVLLFRPEALFDANRVVFRSFNFVPFATIINYINHWDRITWIAFTNLIGNVMAFVPLGILLQALKRSKRIWADLGIVLLTTICIEALQALLGVGACDVDDVILNFAGGAIGIGAYRVVMLITKDTEKARAASIGLLMVLGLGLVVWQML